MKQKNPRLPVPPLHQTLTKYLRHIRPLLTTQQYENTSRIVEEFGKPQGIGEELHALLVQRQQDPNVQNWLEEFWSEGYLTDRSCMGINVSPSLLLTPHPSPRCMDQALRATMLLGHSLDYYDAIRQGTLPPEKDPRGVSLCMEEYHRYFATTRVPRRGRDIIVTSLTARHVVLSHKGAFYRLQVYTDTGARVPLGQILTEITNLLTSDSDPPVTKIGGLTSLDRDTWSDVRDWILKTHKNPNAQSLDDIEAAILLVCLESSRPMTDEECMRDVFYGSVTSRWWDKSIQVTVCANGVAGITFEHSPVDASPSLQWIIRVTNAYKLESMQPTLTALPSSGLLSPIIFKLDENVHAKAKEGETSFQKMVHALDLSVLQWTTYGARYVKEVLKAAPDAFAQMAFQVAFRELFGYTPATYESASTKTFLHGRTETIRSATMESVAFVDTFTTDRTGPQAAAALRLACAVHQKTSRECASGQGQDRHLYGLASLARLHGRPTPEIFTDPSYAIYRNIELSTSHPLLCPVRALCFGPVSEKCIGVCYFLFEDHFMINVTAWRQSERDPAQRFRRALERNLTDMAALLSAHPQNNSSKI